MVTKIKELIPTCLEPVIVRLWYFLRPLLKLIFYGYNKYCPVCDSWIRYFLPHGPSSERRKDAICPVCLCHERHRLSWIFINSCTDLKDGRSKRLLHFAPEPEFARRFKNIQGVDYLSADLVSPHATERMDITDIRCSEGSFDVVYCCHLLEHVVDDRKAMSEIFRVLKPEGWALIQVPISEVETIEDPSITDPVVRQRLFGLSDHVRLYGIDIKDRLAASGFDVEVIFEDQVVPKLQDRRRMSTSGIRNNPLFLCRKPTV